MNITFKSENLRRQNINQCPQEIKINLSYINKIENKMHYAIK